MVAQSVGSTVISASIYGVTTSTNLTVTPPTLSSIAVTPSYALLEIAQTLPYSATATYSDGTTADVTSLVSWASSDTSKATISSAGLATGVAVGETTISATLDGVVGRTGLTVTGADLQSVTVQPSTANSPAGVPYYFTATAHYDDGTSHDVTEAATWTSSNTTYATVETLGDEDPGLATGTIAGIGQSVTITATYGDKSGTATFTIDAATLVSITVSPKAPHTPLGSPVSFTAIGIYSDGTIASISPVWTSSDTSVATINASSGVATPVAVGTTTITATSGAIHGSTPMTVTTNSLVSIAVTPADETAPKGEVVPYTAIGTYADGEEIPITTKVVWTSTNTSVATIVSSTGVATVVGSSGSTTIQATSGSIVGNAQLTAAPATLESVSVAPTTATVPDGESALYSATAHYSDGTSTPVTPSWSTGDSSIATIDSSGLATARASSGSTSIIATYAGQIGTATIVDTSAVLVSIAVTPANPTVPKGETEPFTATATYSDAQIQVVTDQATWTSSNTDAVTISNAVGTKGVATAVNTGSATITATYLGVQGSTTMTVGPAVPLSLSVTPSTVTIPDGLTQPMTAKVTFSDNRIVNETTNSTWSSSDESVATVGASTGIVTAEASSGSATITASYTASDTTVEGTATVTDSAATVTSVAVNPATQTIAAGVSTRFTATATYSDTTTQDVTGAATWASSNTAVATIISGGSQAGYATGRSAGTADITAAFGGQTSPAAVLTVTAPLLQSITVTPANTSLFSRKTLAYTAVGLYSNGSTQDITTTSVWSSSDPAIASIVAATGVATGDVQGEAIISATNSGIVGHTDLYVRSGVTLAVGQLPDQPIASFGNSVGILWTPSMVGNTTELYHGGALFRTHFFASPYVTYFAVGYGQVGSSASAGLIYQVNSSGQFTTPALETIIGGTVVLHDIGNVDAYLIAVGYQTIEGETSPACYISTNGTTWTVPTTPPSTLGSNNQLNGVACQDDAACFAVGQYLNDAGDIRPAIYLSTDGGNNWQSDSAGFVNTTGLIYSVSHEQANGEFFAVGYTGSGSSEVPAVFTNFNAQGSWALQTLSSPGTPSQLHDISCQSGYCVAVGYYTTTSGVTAPLVYTNISGSWSSNLPTPYQFTGGNSELNGVSCYGNDCLAVGAANNNTFPVSYFSGDNGQSWSTATVFDATIPGNAYGVAYYPPV